MFEFNFTKQDIIPFPYWLKNDALDYSFAKEIQQEIMNIPTDHYDRLDNHFESKYVLRDKFNYPPKCSELMKYLTSNEFVNKLSELVKIPLILDTDRNFWGIHKFNNGDKLDIHLDAGIYHKNGLKKCVTIGVYFSNNWEEENGGHLELWDGDSVNKSSYKLNKCVVKVPPLFNTMVIFMNTDNSWHGTPNPVKCTENSQRYFLTCSYLSLLENLPANMTNKYGKAFFITRPEDEYNEEKEKAIWKRVNPETCHQK
jgi:Rps23 Pro-64 3,4-dihydroxylase Tpa1-like proline 4-hydroxylase